MVHGFWAKVSMRKGKWARSVELAAFLSLGASKLREEIFVNPAKNILRAVLFIA
jgi:hypothetical protein